MTVVDTGVVLALLDEVHPRHPEAKRMLRVGSITVTGPTLTEATRVIRRHAKDLGLDGNQVAREALKILRSLPSYRLGPQPPDEDIARIYIEEGTMSYADAWNLCVSLHVSEPLATFDRKLNRAHQDQAKG